MKILVIYYSKTGNTKYLAETIAKEVKGDLLEIKREKDIKGTGFMLYFKGGFQSMTKQKSTLETLEKDPKKYDLIFLGFPIWAWNVHPAIRGLMKEYSFEDKKFALFCSCSGTGRKQLEETKKILGKKNIVLGMQDFVEPLTVRKEEQTIKAKEWVKDILHQAKK